MSFISQEHIQTINHKYRNKNSPTDVLSFPQNNWREPLTSRGLETSSVQSFLAESNQVCNEFGALGDILISIDDAQINAHQINQSLNRELGFLIIHGILHLLGHDHIDKEDEAIMLKEQNILVSKFLDNKGSILQNSVWKKDGSPRC